MHRKLVGCLGNASWTVVSTTFSQMDPARMTKRPGLSRFCTKPMWMANTYIIVWDTRQVMSMTIWVLVTRQQWMQRPQQSLQWPNLLLGNLIRGVSTFTVILMHCWWGLEQWVNATFQCSKAVSQSDKDWHESSWPFWRANPNKWTGTWKAFMSKLTKDIHGMKCLIALRKRRGGDGCLQWILIFALVHYSITHWQHGHG